MWCAWEALVVHTPGMRSWQRCPSLPRTRALVLRQALVLPPIHALLTGPRIAPSMDLLISECGV